MVRALMPLLCVSSPKGGVGKTTLAANLSAQLAWAGRRVIVLDLDPQNSLGLHFGMDLDRREGFMNALRMGAARRPWHDCLLQGPHGLRYLPFGHADMDTANTLLLALTVEPTLLTEPLREMLAEGALVVLDAPPGPSLAMPIVLPMVDLLLVVLLVDATSIAQIPAIESGRAYGLRGTPVDPARMFFVLNQLDLRTRLGRATMEAASRHLGERLIGVVYRDENVAEAIAAQKLIAAIEPNAKSAQDIAALAQAISRRLPQMARP